VRFTDGDSLFAPQLKRIQDITADAVMVWGNAREGALIIKQMRQMGMQQPVFACDRLASGEVLKIAGRDAEGLHTTYPYNPTRPDPELVAFNQMYYARFGQQPDMFAAHAYDGMNILIEAIKKAGLNRARIRDVLTDLKTFQGYEGITGRIIFDTTWNDVGDIWMTTLKQGKFEYFSATPHE